MILKFIKDFLFLLLFLLILIFGITQYPVIISLIAKNFTNYQVEIDKVDYRLNDNKFSIFSNNIKIKNSKTKIAVVDLSFNLWFNDYRLKNSTQIDKLTITLKKIAKNLKYKFNLPDKLSIKQLNLKYKNSLIQTSFDIKKIADKKLISGIVKNFSVADNFDILELIPIESLSQYLQNSLKIGDIKNVNYKIWQDTKGKISVDIKGKIKSGYVKFHPDWEVVNDINSDFSIDNDKLIFAIHKVKIGGIVLDNGRVVVNFNDDLLITINAKIKNKTQKVLAFLQKLPIKSLQNSLTSFNANGKIEALVDIHLFVKNKDKKHKIIVDAKLLDNNFNALEDKLSITKINANLLYDGKLTINGKGGIFNDNYDIYMQYDKFLTINLNTKDTNISISKQKNWFFSILSNSFAGNIIVDNNQNKLAITLKDINITQNKSGGSGALDLNYTDIPDFTLKIENTRINNKLVPNLKTDIVVKKEGLYLQKVNFEKFKGLYVAGIWNTAGVQVFINYTQDKFQKLLDLFDVGKFAKGGDFEMQLDSKCDCKPWQISKKSLISNAIIKIKKGSFNQRAPSMGRVLSLLNFTSILDRLKLDIDDVADKSFNYNQINSKISLKNGVATIDDFLLNSNSSKIKLTGKSDIIKQKYNLNAEVFPAIKDGIPIATALAGGGLAGLGVWLIDKLVFKEKLLKKLTDDAVKFNYKITGDWNNPQMEKL